VVPSFLVMIEEKEEEIKDSEVEEEQEELTDLEDLTIKISLVNFY